MDTFRFILLMIIFYHLQIYRKIPNIVFFLNIILKLTKYFENFLTVFPRIIDHGLLYETPLMYRGF